MSGIDYLVDEDGRKKAVVIDLAEHGAWWAEAEARLAEGRQRWEAESRALCAAGESEAAALLPAEDFSDWEQ